MSDFNDFENRGLSPRPETGDIISKAFENYKGIIGYGILFLILTFIINSIISALFPGSPIDLQSILNDVKEGKQVDFNDIIEQSQNRDLKDTILSLITSVLSSTLLFPLSAGIIYIAHKYNTGQNIGISDMFIGYRQNTGNLMIYGLLISVLGTLGTFLCLLPGLYVYIVGYLGLPAVFFEHKSAVDGFKRGMDLTNNNFGLTLGTAILAFLISIAGILLCGIGLLLTLPFYFSAMYMLYCAVAGTPYEVKKS